MVTCLFQMVQRLAGVRRNLVRLWCPIPKLRPWWWCSMIVAAQPTQARASESDCVSDKVLFSFPNLYDVAIEKSSRMTASACYQSWWPWLCSHTILTTLI